MFVVYVVYVFECACLLCMCLRVCVVFVCMWCMCLSVCVCVYVFVVYVVYVFECGVCVYVVYVFECVCLCVCGVCF